MSVWLRLVSIFSSSLLVVAAARADETKPKKEKTFSLTVLAAGDHHPLENANVRFNYYDGERKAETVRTDADGRASFTYPDATKGGSLGVTVRLRRHVPYYVYFERQPPELLATEKTIRIDRGEIVGGVILGENGEPLEGASVRITAPATESTRSNLVFGMLDMTTTADGAWNLNAAPTPVTELRVRVNHPEYVQKTFHVQQGTEATYQLERGWRIAGTVTDVDRRPIADAIVHLGTDHFGSSKPSAKTDASGRYDLEGLERESTFVTVTAKQHAPQIQSVDPGESEDNRVDFQLKLGNKMIMEVVDPNGKPIQGAGVSADTWRGYRTVDWRGTTDAAGRVIWPAAPEDAVLMDFYCRGYRSTRDVSLVASEKVHRIVLNPQLIVTGSVVDAETKTVVPEFEVCFGSKRPGRDIYWLDYRAKQGRDGKFEITYTETATELYLRITAHGYNPWVSPSIDPKKKPRPYEIQLQPGRGPSGVVVTPDGKPAAGARVLLSTEDDRFQFTSGYRAHDPPQQAQTDDEGRFELQPLTDPKVEGLVAIVHDSGYAEASLESLAEDKPVELEKWARIELKVMKGDTPDPGVKISFDPRDIRHRKGSIFSYAIDAETDERGIAVMERVVPRNGYISPRITQPMKSGWMSIPARSRLLDIEPGETYKVQFGGSGRAIIGRIELPSNPPDSHLWRYNDPARLTTSQFEHDDPEYRTYNFLIDRDGTFRVDDIPVGEYDLMIRLTAEPNASQCGGGAYIGSVRLDSIVHTEDSLSAHDLGTLTGSWIEFTRAGDAAPDFVAATADGKTIERDDFRGQLLLIDFWATWCTPCIAEMPQLAKLHVEYRDDPRFAMLGVAIEAQFSAAVEMASTRGWNWPLADGGKNFSSLFPNKYDVRAIPSKFLIGSDGTILYRGTNIDELSQMIKTTLDAMPARRQPSDAPRGVRSRPVDDDFTPSESTASLVLALDEPYLNKSADEKNKPSAGLFLYTLEGDLVRHVESLAPNGWLKRADRIAIDRARGRVYVGDPKRGLVAVNRDGSYAFETPIESIQAVAVDEKTGDIWCLCSGYLNSGWTIVLDRDGNEKKKHVLAGFSLRYSAAEDAFWFIGKEAKLVARDGTVRCSHALPDDSYTLAALAVDEQGGCWALEDSHPDVAGSRERVRYFTEGEARVVQEYAFDYETDKGSMLRWIEVVGDQVWVGGTSTTMRSDPHPRLFARRYSIDGKLIDEMDQSLRSTASVGGGIWTLKNNGIVTRREDDTVDHEFVTDHQMSQGIYQSVWMAGW